MNRIVAVFLLALSLASGCGSKKNGSQVPASLDDLNRALAVVTMHSGTFPPSTNEIASFLALSGKSMPIAPPGKRLLLDPETRDYRWAGAE